MSDSSFRRFYRRADFVAMLPAAANIPLLATTLNALVLTVPIAEIRGLPDGGAVVEWATLPASGDIALVDAAVAAFVGGTTTGAPQVATNAGPITANNATPVSVIDVTTPPLDAGTYQVILTCQMRMQAEVAGEAARAVLTITPSPAGPRVQREPWPFAIDHAYNFCATFERAAGQTIRVQVEITEIGPGAGVAEMTAARVTIDKIG